jgi:hypothetical protein
LLLYFHFHSSCCLSDIWKRCYASEIEWILRDQEICICCLVQINFI